MSNGEKCKKNNEKELFSRCSRAQETDQRLGQDIKFEQTNFNFFLFGSNFEKRQKSGGLNFGN